MLHEECGVMGAYDFDGNDVALDIYHGLYTLQHRGQESCGIVTNSYVNLHTVKGKGLVNEVFTKDNLPTLKGKIGVGHVLYGYTGEENDGVQPIVSRYCKGSMTIAMNGTITNYDELRSELEHRGAIFQSSSHAEMVMNMIAVARTKTHSAEAAVLDVVKRLKGAFSMVVMSPKKLIAVRDPYGFKPLSLGKRGNAYFFASETAAFDVIRAETVSYVKPGELIKIDDDGVTRYEDCVGKVKPAQCIFEFVYFARPDSFIDGKSVYQARIDIGRELCKAAPADADIVIGVPSSGLHFALGYSYESGLQYVDGLMKNSYVGRTFIKGTDEIRREAVSIKLNALRGAIEGKRVVLVDDSIVRGTTCANLIRLVKQAGAKEVHMRIASPPFVYSCPYGSDIPERKALAAVRMSIEEIRKSIDADSLGYLPMEAFERVGLGGRYCDACFTGNYPDGAKGK
ncbi:MAG: amidophosphoribosyltransferase [Clostridiales bacterium]|nr:amidophosphoribosyltransferase [Clostridiales bacterium]